MSERDAVRINGARLIQALDVLARIGATAGGGMTRLALSDEDREARDLLRDLMLEAGLTVRVDVFGNMTGRLAGSADVPPIQLGSHLDTVRHGGRFDGALGVLAALEVVRTLREARVETRRPIEVVNWTNEEGVRFEPAMMGSGAATGRFDREWVDARTDRDGATFGAELERIGYRGTARDRPAKAAAYLELHIEQGPTLDDAEQAVGVVEGILGITWLNIIVDGRADHAGPSPMRTRRDALVAAAALVSKVQRVAVAAGEPAVGTVGRLDIEPNVINTIPGKVTLSADFRHPTAEGLDEMVAELRATATLIEAESNVGVAVERFWTSEPTPFDPNVIDAVTKAVRHLDLPVRRLWSGAGHDAKYAADVSPSGMIFVRSQGGISHSEEERSDSADIEAGANVLLHTALILSE
ncbi:MAG: Zn-dependent hydrolase [Chloroflexia bacterium]|nr:Zn-dependent hydrolase [Chloroflexia bacterium]